MATFFYILKYKLNFIKRNIFLFLFLFPALENSSAQELLTINSIEKANEQIENYLYLFEDTSSVIDIRQISEMKKQNLLFPLKQFNQKRSP